MSNQPNGHMHDGPRFWPLPAGVYFNPTDQQSQEGFAYDADNHEFYFLSSVWLEATNRNGDVLRLSTMTGRTVCVASHGDAVRWEVVLDPQGREWDWLLVTPKPK